MLTQGEDVEVQALASRGWSVSAIARHLDRDRKTVRAYVRGERQPGIRASAAPDPLAPFAGYLAARFADDPHLWATALFDEVVPLGYRLSYVSFARQSAAGGPAPALRAVRRGIRAGHDRDRSPGGRGDAVGLVRCGGRRRGAAPRMCCWARCRIRAGSAACSPNRWTSRT